MSLVERLNHARDVRQRLRFPVNAVVDVGIDLTRKPVEFVPVERKEIEIIENINLNDVLAIDQAIIELKARVEQLTERRKSVARSLVFRSYPRVQIIQEVVCRHYQLSMLDLLSECREKRLALPRFIAIYLSRHMTPLSLPAIGRYFSGRDHTTILHSVRKIEQKIQTEPETYDLLEKLAKEINRVSKTNVALRPPREQDEPCQPSPMQQTA